MSLSGDVFICGSHRVLIFLRGGTEFFAELTPVTSVRWQRVRDEVSIASATIPTSECCATLSELRTILMEMHIYRNGVPVWQGPITRIEYDWDAVLVHAEDVLWQTKRTVLEVGYDQSYPNIGNVLDRVDWLLRDQTFAKYGDPWNLVPHLHPLRHSEGEPRTTRAVPAYAMYVFEDLDKYAEDFGIDYTVANREVYYFDNHLAWNVLPPLDENHLSQFPRIVEYGFEVATRAFVTDGQGHAGQAAVGSPWQDQTAYGNVDWLINNNSEGVQVDEPTAQDIAQWSETAAKNLLDRQPAPTSVVIPANTTLMPGAPWTLDQMIPGSWFEVNITHMCRTVTEFQRIHEVTVDESAPSGEQVRFTAIGAPSHRVDP